MSPSDIEFKTAALEALQIGVVVHSADTSVIFSNPSAAKRLGLTVDQMSGRAAPDPHWCLFEPDGHPMAVEDYPVSRVVRTEQPIAGMLLGVRDTDRPDAIRWLLVNATPVFKPEGPLDFVVVDFNDITDRRKLEIELESERNKHRIMLRNASDGMCIIDAHGRVEEASDRWCEQLGYGRDEALGMHVSQWEASMDAAGVDKVVGAVIAGRQRVQFETLHRHKDGTVREVEVSAVPFEFDGRPLIFCLTRDVADRKKAQAALEASRLELERQVAQRTADLSRALVDAQAANRAKSLFLSSMSHELRTPLNAVLGYAQLLLSSGASGMVAEQRAQVRQIEASAEHLMALVSDVLDLARIESGELGVDLQPVEVAAKLAKVAASVAPLADKLGVAVVIDAPHGQPWVHADPVRLRQCLINLVSNGIKYNRPGGSVRIAARAADDGVVIAVEDTGRGMTPEQLERLFERFNRLGLEASGIEGTGIGLVITRQLVQQMGGRISVTSSAGQGSTFSIWLPAAEMAPATAPSIVVRPPPPVPDPAHDLTRGALEVVYVEDNEINVALMQAMAARRPGVRLRVARSGAEGLTALREQPAELVLIDMHLGDCHGIELLERLRHELPDPHRMHVVVSADASSEQIHHALSQGFDRYLTKPLRMDTLLALFDEVACVATR